MEKLENNTCDVSNKVDNIGDFSDGYHTFNELYEYRLLYNAGMFNEFAKKGLYDVHKSKRHSDGRFPFDNPNRFIVIAELPTGQISNHYEIKDWNLFQIPEKKVSNVWDGHTPKDVAERLRKFLSLPRFKIGDKVIQTHVPIGVVNPPMRIVSIEDHPRYGVLYRCLPYDILLLPGEAGFTLLAAGNDSLTLVE